MTPDEALAVLNRVRDTPHGRMLWAIIAAIQETRGQYHIANWCIAASEDDATKAWARAVAVLKLPERIRNGAQWN